MDKYRVTYYLSIEQRVTYPLISFIECSFLQDNDTPVWECDLFEVLVRGNESGISFLFFFSFSFHLFGIYSAKFVFEVLVPEDEWVS